MCAQVVISQARLSLNYMSVGFNGLYLIRYACGRAAVTLACAGGIATACVRVQFLRTHSTRNAAAERRIWAFPEQFFNVARDAFHLRYALLPYIYTTARQAYDTGLPLNRPLYYEWPEHDEAYTFQNCYLFGSNLLCCPVVSAVEPASGLATVTMWFPPGIWFNWFTGKR